MNSQEVCITIDDVVKWILANRGSKCFTGWNEEQIALAVEMGMEQNLFLYAYEEEQLLGVCLLRKMEPFKLHISQLLIKQQGLMGEFLKVFQKLWPATKYLTVDRRGRRKTYSVKTLVRLLTQ